MTFVDIDYDPRRVYGYAKQGAGFWHTKIQASPRPRSERAGRGVPRRAAPVIVATRLRKGSRTPPAVPPAWSLTRSSRPRRRVQRAARGAGGLGVLRGRGDRRHPPRRACFSVTAPMDR